MEEKTITAVNEISSDDIRNRIYTIRGVQVMLDSDLAELYQIETGALNRQVKRNIERFPEDFCFQITSEEFDNLKCQIGISSSEHGGRRKLPYAFTEQGISMLSGVIHTDVSIKANINIMRSFVAMRHFIADNATVFKHLEEIDYKLLQHEHRLSVNEGNIGKVFKQLEEPREKKALIFSAGQLYDAASFIEDIISRAKKNIIVIDKYVDRHTLDLLSKKAKDVSVLVVVDKSCAELSLDLEFAKKKKNVIDSVWQVKGKYTGGDRNTDRFFSGIKANKDLLYEKVANFPKQTSAPEKDIPTISKELEVLLKATGDKLPKIQSFKFKNLIDDDKKLLEKEIVGSTNSTFSTLINDLKNSDWVSKGIDYLEDQSEIAKCPFCQQNVDKNHLIQELKTCFDKSYEQDKEKLSALSNLYTQKIEEIEEDSLFTNVTFLNDLKEKYQIALQKLINSLKTNLTLIREKNQTPSKVIILHDVDNEVIAINNVIDEANELIEAFNTKIDKKDESLKKLSNLFWSNIRFQYETTLTNFTQEEAIYLSTKSEYLKKQENIKKEIENQNNIIQIESKKVSNIDDAINNINKRLQELGIDSFKIEKYPEEEALYKLVRIEDNSDNIFASLSGNVRYQAFYRFINRESHSDNINIYDMKEFDYDSFQEAFQKVFKIAGYEDHYKKMRKIGA